MSFLLFFINSLNVSSISTNRNNIPVLNGSNFMKWRKHIVVLRCMDLDYVIWTKQPPYLTNESITKEGANYEKYGHSNHMSLMIMNHSFLNPNEKNAKKLFNQIVDQFARFRKVETSTLFSKLVSIKYKGNRNVREYILEMSILITTLKTLNLELSDNILVHLVLISLHAQVVPLR